MDLKEKTRLLFVECEKERSQGVSAEPAKPRKLTLDAMPSTLLDAVRAMVAKKRRKVQLQEGIGYWWWTPLPDQTCGFGGYNRPAIIADELCWKSRELAEELCDKDHAHEFYSVVRSELLSSLLGGPLWPGPDIPKFDFNHLDGTWNYLKDWVGEPVAA